MADFINVNNFRQKFKYKFAVLLYIRAKDIERAANARKEENSGRRKIFITYIILRCYFILHIKPQSVQDNLLTAGVILVLSVYRKLHFPPCFR